MTGKQTEKAGQIALLIGLLALSGCSSLTPQEQRMMTGAMIGTAAGAAGTAMLGGCVACGAAIGGVVGAGTGYIVDQIQGDSSSSSSASSSSNSGSYYRGY